MLDLYYHSRRGKSNGAGESGENKELSSWRGEKRWDLDHQGEIYLTHELGYFSLSGDCTHCSLFLDNISCLKVKFSSELKSAPLVSVFRYLETMIISI